MNIKELYRMVNILLEERHDEPINGEEYILALSSLVIKGKITQVGDEVFVAGNEPVPIDNVT